MNWSEKWVLSNETKETTPKITDTKPSVPVVILSTRDNAKLFEQLRSALKIPVNRDKYQSNVSPERQNQYFYFLIDPGFRGINRPVVLLFENENDWKVHKGYYLPKVEIKDYNVMIDGKNFFEQPVKSKHMIIFKRLQLFNEMITQLVLCWVKIIWKTIIMWQV